MASDAQLEAMDEEQSLEYIKSGRAGVWDWIWTSPSGVDHYVPDVGPCATCGHHHDGRQNDGNQE